MKQTWSLLILRKDHLVRFLSIWKVQVNIVLLLLGRVQFRLKKTLQVLTARSCLKGLWPLVAFFLYKNLSLGRVERTWKVFTKLNGSKDHLCGAWVVYGVLEVWNIEVLNQGSSNDRRRREDVMRTYIYILMVERIRQCFYLIFYVYYKNVYLRVWMTGPNTGCMRVGS